MQHRDFVADKTLQNQCRLSLRADGIIMKRTHTQEVFVTPGYVFSRQFFSDQQAVFSF